MKYNPVKSSWMNIIVLCISMCLKLKSDTKIIHKVFQATSFLVFDPLSGAQVIYLGRSKKRVTFSH